MSTGKPLGTCKTCECEGCEYERYKTQPELLGVARGFYELIARLQADGCDLFDDQIPLLEYCHAILQKHECP